MKLLIVFFIAFFALSKAQTVHLEDYRLSATPSGALKEFFGYAIEVVRNSSLVLISKPRASNGGVVHVYSLDTTYSLNTTTNETVVNEQWNLVTTLVGSDTQTGDNFGYCISAVEDGNTIIIGAPDWEPGTDAGNGPYSQYGKIYVFQSDGSNSWSQSSTITLTGSTYYDKFGIDCQINDNGDWIIGAAVGLNTAGRMGLYIYQATGGNSWNLVTQLSTNVFIRFGSLGSRFSATPDFSFIAVKSSGGFNQVTLYQKTGASTWTPVGALYNPSNPDNGNNTWFGSAINFDRYAADALFIGAPRLPESAHLYQVPSFNLTKSFEGPQFQNSAFGTDVQIATTTLGRFLVIGAPIDFGSEKGKAYVFKYNYNYTLPNNVTLPRWEALWILQSKDFSFDASSVYPYPGYPTNITYNTGDQFGKTTFISHRHIYVGAPLENAVYIFRLPPLKTNDTNDVQLPSFPSGYSSFEDGNNTLLYGLIAGGVALLLLLLAGFIVLGFVMKKRRQNKIKQLAEKYIQLQQGGKPVKKFSSGLQEKEPLKSSGKGKAKDAKDDDGANWVDTKVYNPYDG